MVILSRMVEDDVPAKDREAAIAHCVANGENPYEQIELLNPYGLNRLTGPRWASKLRKLARAKRLDNMAGKGRRVDKADVDSMPLNFGKYRGLTPLQVAVADPGYVVWLQSNALNRHCVTRELAIDCEERLLSVRNAEGTA